MVFGYFGSLFYVGLLFTNAIAILNEERFLARSASVSVISHQMVILTGMLPLSFFRFQSTRQPTRLKKQSDGLPVYLQQPMRGSDIHLHHRCLTLPALVGRVGQKGPE